MVEFQGRRALVTGAGSGIGAAAARLLAARGAVVFASDLEPPMAAGGKAEGSSESSTHGLRLDVRREVDWEKAVRVVRDQAGGLDVLVHAAGITAASPLTETGLSDWRRVLETNLDGTFLALKHGVAAMRERGGAIVVIGSASGIRASSGAATYSTSKAAVAALVRAAAKECRDAGIPVRINTLSPAGVKTPIWRSMPFFRDLVEEHGTEEAAFAAMEEVGGGRFAEPEEIAECALFLVSDAASRITGVEVPVDDGYVL